MVNNSSTNAADIDAREQSYLALLIGALIVYQTIINGINRLTNIFAANTPLDTLVSYFMMFLLIICAFSVIVRQAYRLILISIYILLLLILWSVLIYPQNQTHIAYYMQYDFIWTFPYLFLGYALSNYKKLFLYLKWLIPLSLLWGLLEYFIMVTSAQPLPADNMAYAYFLLPSVIIAFYFSFTKKKLFDWFCAFSGLLLLVGAGTRGPLLCLIAYIGIYIFTRLSSSKTIMSSILSIAGLVWLIESKYITGILLGLSSIYAQLGLSTRIFDYIISAKYFDTYIRDTILDTIQTAVLARPLIGYGIFGDRSILMASGMTSVSTKSSGGTYVHNLPWELLCNFGIIAGSIIIILLAYIIIKSYIVERLNLKGEFILIVIPMAVVKLLMSNSYWLEPYFFLLLGMCLKTVLESRANLSRTIVEERNACYESDHGCQG